MSNFKGTTGRWFVDNDGDVSSDERCEIVAGVAGCEPSEEDKANARLIAAAPELLEACLRIQAQFRQAGLESKAGSLNPIEDNAAQIDAVILKALGQ